MRSCLVTDIDAVKENSDFTSSFF